MKKIVTLFFVTLLLLWVSDASARTHTVKRGETLDKIAKKYKVRASDIQSANDMYNQTLKIGTKLEIPEKQKKGDRKRDSLSSSTSTQSNTGPAESQSTYHVVRKGESLAKIARTYDLSESQLKDLNHLRKSRLKTGQKLLVKQGVQATHTVQATHKVKKGDSLAKIAKTYHVSVAELKEINGLVDSSLKKGQTLVVARRAPEPQAPSRQMTEEPAQMDAASVVLASEKLHEVKQMSASSEIADLDLRDRLILLAKKMLNLPYRFGGNGPFGIDCSAYVQKVYSFCGLSLPRSAREQFRVGEPIDKEELSVGDLVFFRTYASFPSHVGIYLGNNLFIHASSKSKRVTIDSLETPYYIRRYIGARRLLPDEVNPGGDQ